MKHARYTHHRKSLNPGRKSSPNLCTRAWERILGWSAGGQSGIRPLHCNLPLRISFQTHFASAAVLRPSALAATARERERENIYICTPESAVWANYGDRVAPRPPAQSRHSMRCWECKKPICFGVCLLCLMPGGDARAHSGAFGVRDAENTTPAVCWNVSRRRKMLRWLDLIILLVPGKENLCHAVFAPIYIWLCLPCLRFPIDDLMQINTPICLQTINTRHIVLDPPLNVFA
jgi:hypothetical protein